MGTDASVHQLVGSNDSRLFAYTEGNLKYPVGEVATGGSANGRALLNGPRPERFLIVPSTEQFGIDDGWSHDTAPIVSASSTLCAAS
jgi:hypothetical protein